MKIQNLQILQNNLDHKAYIAHELEIRLLEHLPQPVRSEKKCDILRDCSASMIMEGEFFKQASEFDCIIAHLVPLWQSDLTIFFQKIHQFLSPQGIFLFSTLGKQQVYELETVGDLLLKIGFDLPVVDKDSLQLHYDDREMMARDLELSGLCNNNIVVIEESLDNILIELDVIYGYVSGKKKKSSDTVEIPVSHIIKREQR